MLVFLFKVINFVIQLDYSYHHYINMFHSSQTHTYSESYKNNNRLKTK